MKLEESEVYVDEKGYAHDDEGNTWMPSRSIAPGVYRSGEVPGPSSYRGSRRGGRGVRNIIPHYSERQKRQIDAIDAALSKMPKSSFLQSVRKQVHFGRFLSGKQIKIILEILKKLRMNDKLKAFESTEMTMRELINKLEEGGSKLQTDKAVRDVVGKYSKKVDEVVDKLIFYSQFLEAIQEGFEEAGIPFSHPAWKATSKIKEKFGDAVEAVVEARKFGFK